MSTELLGEFELDTSNPIGKGAWGEVYHGRQVSLDRPVAIKILKKELTADEDFVKRFRRESACLAQMVDEHIIQVYSAGAYKDTYYFVMELVQGQPLSKFIENGRKFSINEIAYVAKSVAKALKTAWESPAKIIHRDIKPSNIMVSYSSSLIAPFQKPGLSESMAALDVQILEAKIKVMDFGLAKFHASGDLDATMAGTVIGTPKYISPEQGLGNPADIRSDIYSLGVVMYEMATGQIPFKAETAISMIRHHIYDTIIPPSKYNQNIPPDFESIILKCLQKEPNQRYANPNELMEALDAFRHKPSPMPAGRDKTGAVSEAAITSEVVKIDRKMRKLIYIGAASFVILAGLVIYLIISRDRPSIPVAPVVKKNIEPEYNKWITEAKNLLAGKRADQALVALKNALKLKPNDAGALELKSQLAAVFYDKGADYLDKKDYNGAIAEYNKAIELNPQYINAYLDRGVVYYGLGEYDRAIANYTQVINLNPLDPLAHYNLGLAYYAKGDYDGAITSYDKAVKLNSRDARAYNGRGLAFSNKGDYDQAIANYTEVININPEYPMVYHNLGLAYANKADYDGAIANYNKAIKLNPQSIITYNNRGVTYANKGNYDLAIKDYNKVIELDPLYADAYYNRGIAYGQKGNYDRAIGDYTRVIELDPKDADAYYKRGLSYESKEDYNRAKADYKRALKINPNHSFAQEKLKTLEGR